MKVFCDMETHGGGWLFFQRRQFGTQDFYLTWEEYAAGFGDLTGEFWIDNRNIHKITSHTPHELLIYLTDFEQSLFARYSKFEVGSESDQFRLTIGGYTGNAGDSMTYHNGQKFSAKDKDYDSWGNVDCARKHRGAWWYNTCQQANLNGLYFNEENYTDSPRGIEWHAWKGNRESLQFTEMLIRPLD
ncbi:hypothetical protein CAPTEDRAFT_134428 [Capitella teleta]|uniref:Fibrinogen C-terminal domain-containing protein n=1 Tax=Capitella teleta TaxID=283909 RepID=R7TUJ9_CAPTE|nr:hypothetical protein CAPTEDRAFT_134428 [Capitella teleta]|eukprot:ELT95151.1 hypothetical protein CAPTEDRAFT_134428 [Capitella teleta]